MLNWIVPAYGRVVIEKIHPSEMTESGRIIIPPTARGQEPAHTGEIVEVSTLEYNPNVDIDEPTHEYSIGDIVVFGKYTGTEIQIGRKNYIIMNVGDILGKLIERPSASEAEAQPS